MDHKRLFFLCCWRGVVAQVLEEAEVVLGGRIGCDAGVGVLEEEDEGRGFF